MKKKIKIKEAAIEYAAWFAVYSLVVLMFVDFLVHNGY